MVQSFVSAVYKVLLKIKKFQKRSENETNKIKRPWKYNKNRRTMKFITLRNEIHFLTSHKN